MKVDYRDGAAVKVTMRKPDDFHQHLRDGSMLALVAPMVAKRFRAAIIMPNLVPPITTWDQLSAYDVRIRRAAGWQFAPLMTLYLTGTLDPAEVRRSLQTKLAIGIKYYPHGLTTNSDRGVKNPADLWTPGTKPYECLQALAEHGGVFLIHAADGVDEQGKELDPYDQERHFIEFSLPRIRGAHPDLKISVEHMSTSYGAAYLLSNGGEKLGCSLTAHHLLLDRRDVFRGGFHPHRSWMPVIQPSEHKEAIRALAAADKPFVWLGSDSAPHPRAKKESACCASGVLMAHAGIELYAEAFEDMGALDDRFERFASINGRLFYELERFFDRKDENPPTIELVREDWKVERPFFTDPVEPREYTKERGEETIVPFRLGENIRWKLVA